jgi:hypothetical protein
MPPVRLFNIFYICPYTERNMKTQLLLLIGIIQLAGLNVVAAELYNGYIITHENDTIYGKIEYLPDAKYRTSLIFYDKDGRECRFSPTDIKAFYLENDNRYFESREISTNDTKETLFLRCLVKGEVSLFMLRGKNETRFFAESENKFVELLNTEIEKEINGIVYSTYKYEYVLILKTEFITKCPELLHLTDNVKFDENSLARFIESYNNCVDKDHVCKVYLMKKNVLQEIGVYLSFSKQYFLYSGFSYGAGFCYEIKYPEFSRSIFFSTGLGFEYGLMPGDHFNDYETDLYKISVPVYFNFQLGHRKAQPSLIAGFKFNTLIAIENGPYRKHTYVELYFPLTVGGSLKIKDFNIQITANAFEAIFAVTYYLKKW